EWQEGPAPYFVLAGRRVFRWNPAPPLPAFRDARVTRFGNTVYASDDAGRALRRSTWFIVRRVINGWIQFITLVAFCWCLFIALGNDAELRRERLGSAGLTFRAAQARKARNAAEWHTLLASEVIERQQEKRQGTMWINLWTSLRHLAAPLFSPLVWLPV